MGPVIEDVVTLTYPVSRGSTSVRVITGVPGELANSAARFTSWAETAEIDRILATPPEREDKHPVWSYAHGA